jgi:peptide/nickel transport system ATP-binding protein
MIDLMFDLQDQFDTSFLFISHNLSNARYLAKKTNGRIQIMYLGEVIEIGLVNEVLENPQYTYSKVLRWATPASRWTIRKWKSHRFGTWISLIQSIHRVDSVPYALPRGSGNLYTAKTFLPHSRFRCQCRPPASCFRVYRSTHVYWNSTPIEDDKEHPNEANRSILLAV